MAVVWDFMPPPPARKRTPSARQGFPTFPQAVRSGASGPLVAWRTGEGPVSREARDALRRTQARVLRELAASGKSRKAAQGARRG